MVISFVGGFLLLLAVVALGTHLAEMFFFYGVMVLPVGLLILLIATIRKPARTSQEGLSSKHSGVAEKNFPFPPAEISS
jgi:peptidoglycan/LPS O-acetylase OafA/YrhL